MRAKIRPGLRLLGNPFHFKEPSMKKCFLTLLVVFLLANSSVILAQDKTQASSKAGTVRATDDAEMYQINFPGGSLGAFVKLVRQMNDSEGKACQMVVTEGAKDYPLPEIEVRTNVEGAIGIMEACSNETATIYVNPTSPNVLIVTVEREQQPQTVVLNVQRILERVDQESMLSAISVGMEMLAPSEKVQLKLHEETGLFFVKGSQASCRLVGEIVEQLEMGSYIRQKTDDQPSKAIQPFK